MTKALQLLSLHPGTVRLRNALVSHLLPASINLDNGQEAFIPASLTCPIEHNSEDQEAFAFTLYINMNGLWRVEFANLDVLALRQELAEWLQADPANQFALLPPELLRAILERLFLPVLDAISKYTGLPAIFVGTPRASNRPLFTEHLDLLLRVEGKTPISTLLRLAWQDTATLSPVAEYVETLPLLKMPVQFIAEASVPVGLVIGAMQLTVQELQSLRSGDILLPTLLYPAEPRLRLARNLYFVCDLDGSTLSVRTQGTPATLQSESVTNEGQNMSDSTNDQTTEQAINQENLNNLELEISFELPGLRLSLDECARLVPGYTLTLSADVAHLPVTILAGGKAVATGRLVDVGGTVGVQITQRTNN